MIEQLFGSKTRVKLLSLFMNNPGRPFYVREITRKIDEQINSVRRELANLLSIGIVGSDGSNNRLYYEVNQKFEYYQQLHSIFSTMTVTSSSPALEETREEDQIIKKLRSAGSIDYAFLAGSFVLGAGSGIDIFIVGDINKARLAKAVAELEESMGRELNYTALTPADYKYRLSLNDRFVGTLLEGKKIVIIDVQDKSLAHSDVSFGEKLSDEPTVTDQITGEQVPIKIHPVHKD